MASFDTAQIAFYVVMAVAGIATVLLLGVLAQTLTHVWSARVSSPEPRLVHLRPAFHH